MILKAGTPVLVRDSNTEKWRYDIFRYYSDDDCEYTFICMTGCYSQCITYEDNKELLDKYDYEE